MAVRLGEALVKEGLITNEQLAKALERQVVYGGRLGTNLIELGILTEESLVKFLGKVFGVPYADPKSFEGIKRQVIETLSPALAGKYMVVPIDLEPKRLHLAMLNPTDLRVMDEVRFATGYEIVPYIASELRLLYALERYYNIQRPIRFISVISEIQEEVPSVAGKPTPGAGRMADRAESAPVTEDVSHRLAEARDREEVATAILEFASSRLKRVALFVVKSNLIVGWRGGGELLTDDAVSQIELPLHQPSIFRTVIEGKDFYQGTLLPLPQNLHLVEMMGGEMPQEAIAFPLLIKGKVVAVLYGDNGERSLLLGDYEELKKVMLKASMALEMLILRKKILEM